MHSSGGYCVRQTIKTLDAQIQAERERLIPRKKFAFKGNKRTAPKVVDVTAPVAAGIEGVCAISPCSIVCVVMNAILVA